MNYTDQVFIVFFLVTFSLYYLASNVKQQLLIIILASLFFYAWEAPLLLVIFLCSWVITGVSSWYVLSSANKNKQKLAAFSGVITNLLMLGFFKYKLLFVADYILSHQGTAQSITDWLILAPLPIGISFYTFHGISLLVDIYRGTASVFVNRRPKIVEHLSETLLYLVFFPQLIAGPIIKAKDFYPQVSRKRFGDIDFTSCFRLLILGYFLKSVVADNLSEQTFWIAYPYFQWRSSGDLLMMLYGYSAQIFADFAGYSIIAIGLGKLLGYNLPENFNFPYLSSSISEFWKRWHISLSSWLRDYLYIPLGGNKAGNVRTYINLLVVMVLGGLWHGAALSFLVWGLWHGLGLALERPWINSRIYASNNFAVTFTRVFIVFNFVTIGWLFFKLQDFSQALGFMKTLVHPEAGGILAINNDAAFYILSFSVPVVVYHLFSKFKNSIPRFLKDSMYGVMLFLILTSPGPSKPFIYFQF